MIAVGPEAAVKHEFDRLIEQQQVDLQRENGDPDSGSPGAVSRFLRFLIESKG